MTIKEYYNYQITFRPSKPLLHLGPWPKKGYYTSNKIYLSYPSRKAPSAGLYKQWKKTLSKTRRLSCNIPSLEIIKTNSVSRDTSSIKYLNNKQLLTSNSSGFIKKIEFLDPSVFNLQKHFNLVQFKIWLTSYFSTPPKLSYYSLRSPSISFLQSYLQANSPRLWHQTSQIEPLKAQDIEDTRVPWYVLRERRRKKRHPLKFHNGKYLPRRPWMFYRRAGKVSKNRRKRRRSFRAPSSGSNKNR